MFDEAVNVLNRQDLKKKRSFRCKDFGFSLYLYNKSQDRCVCLADHLEDEKM